MGASLSRSKGPAGSEATPSSTTPLDVGDFLAALFGLQEMTPIWVKVLHHPHPHQLLPQLPSSIPASIRHDLQALPDLVAALEGGGGEEVMIEEWLQDSVGLSGALLGWIGREPFRVWNGHQGHLVHLIETRLALLRSIHFILRETESSELDHCHELQCLFEAFLSLAMVTPSFTAHLSPLLGYLTTKDGGSILEDLLLEAINYAICHGYAPVKAMEWFWEGRLHLSIEQVTIGWYLVGRCLLEAQRALQEGKGNGKVDFYYDSPTSRLALSLQSGCLLPGGTMYEQQVMSAWMRVVEAAPICPSLDALIKRNGQHLGNSIYEHLLMLAQSHHSDWLVDQVCRLAVNHEANGDFKEHWIASLINQRCWEEAYALVETRDQVRHLVCAMAEHGAESTLCSLPWRGLEGEVEQAIRQRAMESERPESPNWHYLLHSFLVTRHHHQLAAQALWPRIQQMQQDRSWQSTKADYGLSELLFALRLAINCLCLAGEDDAWIIADTDTPRVLSLDDLRTEAKRVEAKQLVNCPDSSLLIPMLLKGSFLQEALDLGAVEPVVSHLNTLLRLGGSVAEIKTLPEGRKRFRLSDTLSSTAKTLLGLLEAYPLLIRGCCEEWLQNGLPPKWLLSCLMQYDPDAFVRLLCARGQPDIARTMMREYGTLGLCPQSMLMLM